jgi:hypothetical protein
MPYCASCGSELRGDTKFCASCGQPVGQSAAAAEAAPPPAPPAPPAYTAPPAPPLQPAAPITGYAPPPLYPGPKRRSFTWAWISGAAAVVVIAVVCVLVFVVFKGGDDTKAASVTTTIPAVTTVPVVATNVTLPTDSTDTTSSLSTTTTQTAPDSTATTVAANADDAAAVKAVVMQLFTAMEKQDVEMLFGLMDPATLAALPEGQARDAAFAAVKAELAAQGTMKFSGIEVSVEVTGPTTATATLTAGVMTLTDSTGTTTEDIKDSSTPGTMDLTKQNGKWYISSSFFE